MASIQSFDENWLKDETPFNIDGVKSAQLNQVLFSGTVIGIINKIMITTGKIIFVKYCLFCSNIFWVKIASPIEPRIIIPTDANNSSLTNAELT